MKSRIGYLTLGVIFYVALGLSLAKLGDLAFSDGSGPIPLWYASVQILLQAAAAVAPGLLVGWLSRERGLLLGTLTGLLGALIGNLLTWAFWGFQPLTQFGWRVAVGAISVTVAASLTNAIGGVAGAALRNHVIPSDSLPKAEPARTAVRRKAQR